MNTRFTITADRGFMDKINSFDVGMELLHIKARFTMIKDKLKTIVPVTCVLTYLILTYFTYSNGRRKTDNAFVDFVIIPAVLIYVTLTWIIGGEYFLYKWIAKRKLKKCPTDTKDLHGLSNTFSMLTFWQDLQYGDDVSIISFTEERLHYTLYYEGETYERNLAMKIKVGNDENKVSFHKDYLELSVKEQ